MRKLIGGLFIVTCMVLMSGCGNHSLGPGNYTFKHIHLTDSVKGHCATVESWRDDDVGIEVKTKKNSVSGLTFAEVIDYALQLKQEDNDEIYDALYKTARSKFFYGELDPTNKKHIAKQWSKSSETSKEEQELALNGKAISTAYIYKLQSLANEDLDDAREAGQEAELLRDIREELMRAVKGLAVRAILVGDAVNPNGSQVTVFETIGAKTRTRMYCNRGGEKFVLLAVLKEDGGRTRFFQFGGKLACALRVKKRICSPSLIFYLC